MKRIEQEKQTESIPVEENNINNENKKNTITLEKKQKKQKKYMSFLRRIILYSVLFIVFVAVCALSFVKSFTLVEEKVTTYNEFGSIDYKVYLKPNDFYEREYLDKNMFYIASLISNIKIDFRYNFSIAEMTDMDFNYSVIGKLTIADEAGTNVYFSKNYTLLNSKNIQVTNDNKFNLSESINIDYSYYNKLANDFKAAYGVNSVSDLTIYLNVGKNVSDKLNNNSSMVVKIPLSEKAININIDSSELNNSSFISNESESLNYNIAYILGFVFAFVMALVPLSELMKLLFALVSKKSNYDKYIKKLFTDYDRFIVETTSNPKIEEHNIIKILNFDDILDVRDNLKLPIMYYNVTSHQKCYFYIKDGENLYLLVIKAVDLELKKKKK